MKGFVYMLEIAIASILLTVVLVIFFTTGVKVNWERPDLIAIGNNVLQRIRLENSATDILNNNFTLIDKTKPPNIKFAMRVSGTPKNNISVGCNATDCNYVRTILSPAYVNGHWVNFTVINFNPAAFTTISDSFDAIVLVNYTDYSSQKTKFQDYLSRNKVIVGINGTVNNSNTDFNQIFNLSPLTQTNLATLNFSSYNPSLDGTMKYFFGFGFDVNLVSDPYWYIWENKISVSTPTPTTVRLGGFINFPEGQIFSTNGPDGSSQFFKVKKIWYNSRVEFQPLNLSFPFKNFSEQNVTANGFKILMNTSANPPIVGMSSNGNAIWISDFPRSDEYRTLVKAAIASRLLGRWELISPPQGTVNSVSSSSFFTLCCDMPESLEYMLILWYSI